MAQFEFNDENSSRRLNHTTPKSSYANKLISWGLAKNEQQANLYLLVLVIIGFGLIVYMNLKTFSSPPPLEEPTTAALNG